MPRLHIYTAILIIVLGLLILSGCANRCRPGGYADQSVKAVKVKGQLDMGLGSSHGFGRNGD